MTKEELQKRLEWLTQQRDGLNAQITQMAANISAFNGAISECNYWASLIVEKEAQDE